MAMIKWIELVVVAVLGIIPLAQTLISEYKNNWCEMCGVTENHQSQHLTESLPE